MIFVNYIVYCHNQSIAIVVLLIYIERVEQPTANRPGREASTNTDASLSSAPHIRYKIMNFNDYQAFFVSHQANYQIKESDRLAIITLGLAGETGEAIEHIKKFIRDGKLDKDALSKELGDVLAYLAIVADYFDLSLDDIATASIAKNEKRKNDGTLHGAGDNR